MAASEDRFRSGDPRAALDELQREIRADPADGKKRIFLAQLLMLLGQWDRALTQLALLGEMDASALPMVHTYRSAIQCEQLRASVFRGERSPLVFGDPAHWVALMIQALALPASNAAAKLRATALELAPTAKGTINGERFEWVADADSRLGPVLEIILNGAYYWVPIDRLQRLVIEPPVDVRDLVWVPAECTWANGGEAMALIPTRYVGSEDSEHREIQLARRTEWVSLGEDAYRGLGQRVVATDAIELPLLELRELTIDPQSSN